VVFLEKREGSKLQTTGRIIASDLGIYLKFMHCGIMLEKFIIHCKI
jgi:hypothetical protein